MRVPFSARAILSVHVHYESVYKHRGSVAIPAVLRTCTYGQHGQGGGGRGGGGDSFVKSALIDCLR